MADPKVEFSGELYFAKDADKFNETNWRELILKHSETMDSDAIDNMLQILFENLEDYQEENCDGEDLFEAIYEGEDLETVLECSELVSYENISEEDDAPGWMLVKMLFDADRYVEGKVAE